MRSQLHNSPDGLLTLTSEPTRTIDDAHPEGRDDWIISIEPGPWHTHPDLVDTDAFIADILKDRTILAVFHRSDDIESIQPLSESIESHIEREQSLLQAGEITIYRSWSGVVHSRVQG